MTKEEYIVYKKALFQEEYETKIRRLEEATNEPKNYVFVYCNTNAVTLFGRAFFERNKVRLFKNELLFYGEPVKWKISECYCGNNRFFFDEDSNRVCSKCFKTYINRWGCLMTEHISHWESLAFYNKTHPQGMTDAFSITEKEFDEMTQAI